MESAYETVPGYWRKANAARGRCLTVGHKGYLSDGFAAIERRAKGVREKGMREKW
jgi:hypothetical protein